MYAVGMLVGVLVLWVGAAVVQLLGLWHPEPPDYSTFYPAGSCVIYAGALGLDPEGNRSIEGAPCNEPHTHVVGARTNNPSLCPADTNATFWFASGADPVVCLVPVAKGTRPVETVAVRP